MDLYQEFLQAPGDTFRFWIPADVEAVVEKGASKSTPEKRVIKGYASTSAKDAEEETVVQKGLDLEHYLERGHLNYDHQRHMIVGWPTSGRIDAKGFYTEGRLLIDNPMADHIWMLAKSFQKSGSPRRLGFSIEGKVLEKDGKTIKKAKVYNVAITPHAINKEASWEAVVKSMTSCTCADGDCCKPDLYRALTSGYATALDEQTGGDALRVESLDRKLKVTAPGGRRKKGHSCKGLTGEAKDTCLRLATRKSLDFSDAVTLLQLSQGWSRDDAEEFVRKVAGQASPPAGSPFPTEVSEA